MIRIEERSRGRDNNFNLLRMIAASAVLISHAPPLALGPEALEPLQYSTGYKLGSSAVIVFFAVSGFFITKSFEKRSSIVDFVIARIARIYPAFIVVTLLSILIIGPIFTGLPLIDYIEARHTWTFLPRNLSLKYIQWTLPGVFSGKAVNGSLWTLNLEVFCYFLVMVCGILRLSRPAFFFLLVALATIPLVFVARLPSGEITGVARILTLPFALGAAGYVYRRYIPVSVLLCLLLFGLAALARHTYLYDFFYILALSYGAIWFGFAALPWVRRYNRFGDYSYGMYIYAFPVAQMIRDTGPITPVALIAIGLPITLVLAVISWHWIESPALNHRHSFAARLRLRANRNP